MGQAGQRESVPRRGRGSWRAGPGRQRRGEGRASGCRRWRVGPGAQGGVLVWELASRWSRPARGGASVLGRGSGAAGWAGSGWSGRRERLGREEGGGFGLGSWVWVLCLVFPFLLLFLFYFSLKLNYLNSKEILNSNPYEIKQLKQCISMNASTKLNLRKF